MKTYVNPSVIELVSPGILQKNELIEQNLNKHGADPELVDIVKDGLTEALKPGICSYEALVYVIELQIVLIRFTSQPKIKQVDEQLRSLLFYANFNSPEFVTNYQNIIRASLAECIDVSLQLDQLYFWQKHFSTYPQRKSASSFHPDCKRVNDQMLDFVNAELSYLHQKHDSKGMVQKMDEYKIKVSFSVDALAYFIKLLIKAKVIDQGVRSELLAFVARRFQTPGISSKGMSVLSLGVKYKQVVHTTAMHVRAVLMTMIKLIDEEF
jgi:hypothetical protein